MTQYIDLRDFNGGWEGVFEILHKANGVNCNASATVFFAVWLCLNWSNNLKETL